MMAVTQKEIKKIPRCPVCDAVLIASSKQYACCPNNLEHTKLRPDRAGPQLNRVREVAQLPIAKRAKKKDAVYLVNGKEYGRCQVGRPDTHWPGEIVGRTEFKPGEWTCIRLVPVKSGEFVQDDEPQNGG